MPKVSICVTVPLNVNHMWMGDRERVNAVSDDLASNLPFQQSIIKKLGRTLWSSLLIFLRLEKKNIFFYEKLKSLDLIYIVTYHIQRVKASWTYSIWNK